MSFFVGFSFLLLIAINVLNKRIKHKVNIYFLVILGIAGMQRFLHGLEVFGIVKPFIDNNKSRLLFTFFIPPIYFLFFKTLLNRKTPLKKDLILFLITVIIIATSLILNFSKTYNKLLFFIYSTTYLVVIIVMVYKYIYKLKNLKEFAYYNSIKNWSFIMLTLFIILYLSSNYILNTNSYSQNYIVLYKYYNVSTFIWLFILIYLLINPVILYGNEFLLKNLKKSNTEEIPTWRIRKVKTTEKTDLEIEKKVHPNLESIFVKIKKYEIDLDNDFATFSLQKLSLDLKLPQSHLKYIYKYYCYYSFSQYQNVLRIKYAILLIKSGYLSNQTIDSLSTQCFFTNRSTFFKNFKKITGLSPSDYLLNFSKIKQI